MFSIAESGINEKRSSTVDDEIFGAGCVIKTRPAPYFLLPLKAVLANTYISFFTLFHNELLMVLDVYAFGR